MKDGWIKLWRQALDHGWLRNGDLWRFWCWCLLRANHEACTTMVGYQKVELNPGDFVFGRKVASHELKMSERTVRTCLDNLRKLENLTIKTTNKFSIISIVNWGTYQGNDGDDRPTDRPMTDQQVTSNRPTSDQQVTTEKNVRTQECKNTRIQEHPPSALLPEWLNPETWTAYLDHRKIMKSPMTLKAQQLAIAKLERMKEQGHDVEAVINQSIEMGWKGLFELKESKGKGNGSSKIIAITHNPDMGECGNAALDACMRAKEILAQKEGKT